MDPMKVSAQFAALVWYSNQKKDDPKGEAGAARFARKHWPAFLPLAHEGLGRLLLKIASPRMAAADRETQQRRAARTNRTPKRTLAVAV